MNRRTLSHYADFGLEFKPFFGHRLSGGMESARAGVARSVNTTQVVANWLIGREIVEAELQEEICREVRHLSVVERASGPAATRRAKRKK